LVSVQFFLVVKLVSFPPPTTLQESSVIVHRHSMHSEY